MALALTITLVAGTSVSTHRLDEYLQAARISVEPDGILIDLELTPGVSVTESVIATIDRDRDGSLSQDEERAYADHVVTALGVTLDGGMLTLRLTSSTFPAMAALRQGEGTIRLEAAAGHPDLPVGPHQLFFKHADLGSHGAYLANALVPETERISVTGQRRETHQSELTIDYAVRAESTGSVVIPWLLVSLISAAGLMAQFTRRPSTR